MKLAPAAGLSLLAIAALTAPAAAQTTIGTTLNGAEANTNFGYSGTFFGQVFTVPTDNVLNSFSVQVLGGEPETNFFLYAFNLTQGFATGSAAGYTTGGPLFSSGPVAGVSVPTGYYPYTALEDTYQTGGLTLTPGGTYLALIENITPQVTPGVSTTQAPLFADDQFIFQHYPGYNYDLSGACVVGFSPTDLFQQSIPGADLAFQASFGPAPVPEASTTVSLGLLLALGLGGVMFARKKRTSAHA